MKQLYTRKINRRIAKKRYMFRAKSAEQPVLFQVVPLLWI